MGAFQNPNFVAEFTYRTKWNYYMMRTLHEKDKEKQSEYENKLKSVEREMESRNYEIDDFYEVTQLVNSMIGLLVFPEQIRYKFLSKREDDLKKQFPTIYKCIQQQGAFFSTYLYTEGYEAGKPENKSPECILRHMRNAVAHERMSIFPVNGRLRNGKTVIEAIKFKDYRKEDKRYKEMNFELTVPVNELEPMLMEICDSLLKMTR